jgi:hypothetical protein
MDENRNSIEMKEQSAEWIRRQKSYREKREKSKDRKSIYITRTIGGIWRTKNGKIY